MSTLTPIIYTLFPLLFGLVAAWFWRSYDASAKVKDAVAAERKLWRQQRLDVETSLKESVNHERAARLEWQLKREAELASIAGILKDSNAANQLLAAIAATSQAHNTQLLELTSRLNMVQQQIMSLATAFPHAKHP